MNRISLKIWLILIALILPNLASTEIIKCPLESYKALGNSKYGNRNNWIDAFLGVQFNINTEKSTVTTFKTKSSKGRENRISSTRTNSKFTTYLYNSKWYRYAFRVYNNGKATMVAQRIPLEGYVPVQATGRCIAGTKSQPSLINDKKVKIASQSTEKVSNLRSYFNQKTLLQRKLIQTNLQKLGLYKSSIDGLFGKATLAALEAYNRQKLNNADLKKTSNINNLLDLVLEIPKKKICSSSTPEVCSEARICRLATATNGNSKVWDDRPSMQGYVKNAKKRGLSCGVKAGTVKLKTVEQPKRSKDSEAEKKERYRLIQKDFGLNLYGGFIYSDRLPRVLFFFSDIRSNDSFEFRKALRNHDIALIVLSSPGGNVEEGLQIAGIINDKGLDTYVAKNSIFGKGNCASACSFMFFAGKSRIAEGSLGVHQFYSSKASEDENIGTTQKRAQYTVSEIIGFLNEFETPPWVFERMFQQSEMYYFKESELEKLETEVSAETKKIYDKAEKFISDLAKAFKTIED
ncbi:MAG: hypothetical protein P8L40_00460 [Planktomarina sp.]|nr:hypothetical protein [Planktomarina sp.]